MTKRHLCAIWFGLQAIFTNSNIYYQWISSRIILTHLLLPPLWTKLLLFTSHESRDIYVTFSYLLLVFLLQNQSILLFTLRSFQWVSEIFSMKCSLSLFSHRQHYLKIYSFICYKIFETIPFGLKPIGSSSKTPPYHHHHPSPTWAY